MPSLSVVHHYALKLKVEVYYSISLRVVKSAAYLTLCSLILKREAKRYMMSMLATGVEREIHMSWKARLLASLVNSGMSRGVFVLLYIKAQKNHERQTSSMSKVHLACLGNNMESTMNKFNKGFPY